MSVGEWRSLVARFVRDEEVPGSNPGSPTISFLSGVNRFGPATAHDAADKRGFRSIVGVLARVVGDLSERKNIRRVANM